jgi:hypothetical protein
VSKVELEQSADHDVGHLATAIPALASIAAMIALVPPLVAINFGC